LNALKRPLPKPIISTTKFAGKKLVLTETLYYSTCKGYEKPSTCKDMSVILFPELISDVDIVIPFGSINASSIPQAKLGLLKDSQSKPSNEVNFSTPDDNIPHNELLNSDNFESMVDEMVE
jgi:hypothetical protein